MKKSIRTMLLTLALIVLVAGGFLGKFLYDRYSEGDERADLNAYFEVEEGETALVIDHTLVANQARMVNGVYYLDLITIHEYFHDRFYVSVEDEELRYTDANMLVVAKMDSSAWTKEVADQVTEQIESYTLAFLEGETAYIAIDFVAKFVPLGYAGFEEPSRLVVSTELESHEVALLKEETVVRRLAGIKSEILTDVSAEDSLYVLNKDSVDGWIEVATYDGYRGYVREQYISEYATMMLDLNITDYVQPEYTSVQLEEPVSLGFHAIYGMAGNDSLSSLAATAHSMNVISPTWYAVDDVNGGIASFASASYVTTAHALGLDVWALVDDFSYDVDMYEVLSKSASRTNLINNLMEQVALTGIDGINIDFEGIRSDEGIHFIQFLRELSIECREEGIVLSVDNYAPNSGNGYYDYEEQGIVCDYVVLMGYDEHWGGSGDPGSTSSQEFTNNSLTNITELVPADKVIHALPFYTRLWKTDGDTVTDSAIIMLEMQNVVNNYGMSVEWNDETGQNYAWVENSEGVLYQMWIEDITSLQNKLEASVNHEVAGVAAWRLGFENKGTWDLIQIYLDRMK